MTQLRLLTIPMSHYCEKARWGLERLGLSYYEERHLQIFHYPRTYWISKGPNVPVLVDGDEVVADSTRILQHLDQYAPEEKRLYPADPRLRKEVEELEDQFDEELGVDSRRWVYYHMRTRPGLSLRTAGQGAPFWELAAGTALGPILIGIFVYGLNATRAATSQGVKRCWQIVEQLDQRLADGRRYLTGERFTAADLSLACMFAPFVLPANYGIRLPQVDELPAAMAQDAREFRSTRTGKFVLRLFEHDRTGCQAV